MHNRLHMVLVECMFHGEYILHNGIPTFVRHTQAKVTVEGQRQWLAAAGVEKEMEIVVKLASEKGAL